MTIHEPATFATDCLLALLSGFLAFKLWQPAPNNSPARLWLARAFWLLALSALIGGTYHGFAREVSEPYARAWWRLTLLSLNLVSAALSLSLLHAIARSSRQTLWRAVTLLKLAGFIALSILYPRFVVAIADYGLTLLAWLCAALIFRPAWWKWMSASIALSAIAALVQQLKLAPSTTFNHNDLYHVIQALALIALYQAGLRLPSRPQ